MSVTTTSSAASWSGADSPKGISLMKMEGDLSMRRGFSLIELMVVMAIVAILVATILPAWSRYRTWQQLRETAYQVVSLLRKQQASAIETRFSRAFFCAPNSGGIPANYWGASEMQDGSWEEDPSVDLPLGLTFEREMEIRFSPSGAPSKAGTIRIFSRDGTSHRDIAIAVGTGRVYLK